MALDPSTDIGKIRLRVGDYSDLPILPDSVISSALADCQGNIPRAVALCAQYILASLTAKTHKRLSQIESWGNEQFDNYVTFLRLTVLNPNMSMTAPVPYVVGDGIEHPIVGFIEDWNGGAV